MKLTKYPDQTSYVTVTQVTAEPIIRKVNTYEDLHHLEQEVDAITHFVKGDFKPTIILPNLIDAQADRRFNYGESSGLKIVLKRLDSMNANFKIFHPHNAEVVEMGMDNVEIIDNSEFITDVLGKIYGPNAISNQVVQYHNVEVKKELGNLILLSSDAGGFKPLMKLCDKIRWRGETYSASKSRSYVDGKSKLIQLIDRQDFQGKDVLIIDDLSIGGGTFKGLSKLLRERNVGKLYLAVSHMTVQNLGQDPVTNYFDAVFCTNSKFDEYYVGDGHTSTVSYLNPKNLEIIKMF